MRASLSSSHHVTSRDEQREELPVTEDTRIKLFFCIVGAMDMAMVFASGWFAQSGPLWASALLGVFGLAWTIATAAAFILVFE